MLLRGPQTPGELKTRTNRLAEFDNVDEIEETLNKLHQLNGEKLVVKLEREPGKREARYGHLFSGEDGLQTLSQTPSKIANTRHDQNESLIVSQALGRITQLEQQVADLTSQLIELKEMIDILSE